MSSLTTAQGLTLPQSIGEILYLNSLKINDLLNIKLPTKVYYIIYLEDFTGSLEELKNRIEIKKEQNNLNQEKEILSGYQITEEQPKRGSINILMILIPAITIILGIILANILYF